MRPSRPRMVQNLLHDIQAAVETRGCLASSSLAQRRLFLRALREDVLRRQQLICRANVRDCDAYSERSPHRTFSLGGLLAQTAAAAPSASTAVASSLTSTLTSGVSDFKTAVSPPVHAENSAVPSAGTTTSAMATSLGGGAASGASATSRSSRTRSGSAPLWEVSANGVTTFTSPLISHASPTSSASTSAALFDPPPSPSLSATLARTLSLRNTHEQMAAAPFTSGGSGLHHSQFSRIKPEKLCAMIDYLLTLPDPLALPEDCWLNALPHAAHEDAAPPPSPSPLGPSPSTYASDASLRAPRQCESFHAHPSDPAIEVSRIPVPIGLVGVLSRYRPRMCIDAVSMGILTGNAMLIDAGSTLHCTNLELMESVHRALSMADLPTSSVVYVQTYGGRSESTTEWLQLTDRVDLGLVCGPPKLYKFATEVATIPLLRATGHSASLYVDQSALFDMALDIIRNSKFQKHAAANSVTTLIVHQNFPRYAELLSALAHQGMVILGDHFARDRAPDAVTELVSEEEYNGLSQGLRDLVSTVCVKSVDSLEQALLFLDLFGAKQADGIIASDVRAIESFCRHVDSCAVLVNTSTRLSSGVSLGCGPDLAVATSKIHCRGPITVSTLVTTKFLVKSRTRGRAALRHG